TFVVIKQFVVGCIVLLLADVLLNIEFTGRFFGLEKRPDHTETGYIISVSLLIGVLFWVIDSVIGSVIFYPGSSFIDMLALNIPPAVFYVRTFFILACLAGGLMFSNLLHKRYETESKFKYLYSMVRLMCDNLPDLIWTKDLKSRFIFVNKSCSEILLNAKDTDEPIGKDDIYFAKREKASHPGNPDYHTFGETYTDSDLMVMETNKPIRGEEFGNLKGENIYLDVYKAPFIDDNNNMIGTVGCARIITKEKELEEARKKTENELHESEEKLSQIVSTNPIPSFVIDIDHTVTHWNKACENLTGVSLSEVIGTKKLWPYFYPEERPVLADLIVDEASEQDIASYYTDMYERSTVVGGAYEAERFSPNMGKSGKWLFITASPLKDRQGKVIGAIETLQDITKRKQDEEELSNINTELEERVAMRTAELQDKNAELEEMNKVFVGREIRMAKLKNQIAKLEKDAELYKKAGDKTS
ncbi:MAG: PAS domain S-box protein, partial [Proteobacteria bacterium]|nr:PAS domain S-box protein [Pseudomonadota bacterium]